MDPQRLLEHALDRAAGSRVIPGNSLEHLPDSPATLAGLRAEIEGARERQGTRKALDQVSHT
jgi:hypothetical protein